MGPYHQSRAQGKARPPGRRGRITDHQDLADADVFGGRGGLHGESLERDQADLLRLTSIENLPISLVKLMTMHGTVVFCAVM